MDTTNFPTSSEENLQAQLQQLISAGTAKSTRRSYIRDVRYFWTWAHTRLQLTEHYPIATEVILQFIVDHVSGLPATVDQLLVTNKHKQQLGPIKITTIKRYLSSVSVVNQEHGHPSPLQHHQVKLLLRRARAATVTQQQPDQKAAITKAILQQLIATCDDSLHGVRDKAILLVGFASGGRRRSELHQLKVKDLTKTDHGYELLLRQSKTDQQGQGYSVPLTGEAASALTAWLVKSGIREGYVFRGIKYNNTLYENFSGRSINRMIKRRIATIGLDPDMYGAHSLRSGFLTEAGKLGLHLRDAMQLSGHRDTKTALRYYRPGELQHNPAAQIFFVKE